jgi:hypothetical protein
MIVPASCTAFNRWIYHQCYERKLYILIQYIICAQCVYDKQTTITVQYAGEKLKDYNLYTLIHCGN